MVNVGSTIPPARPHDWAAVLFALAPGARPASIRAGLASAMPRVITLAGLTSDLRLAHFFAQCAHESAGLTTTREMGDAAYFTRHYEGRRDLGNTQPGDGARFHGRGLIQLTGRANYAHASKELCVDLVAHPELVEAFPYAAIIAALFWRDHGLNALADADDARAVTRDVNGGLNGLASRLTFLAHAKQALRVH